LILGQIVLDDAINNRAGLSSTRSGVNDYVSIQIERETLGGVQTHQKPASTLTSQTFLAGQ
jgi:hypothetical protein